MKNRLFPLLLCLMLLCGCGAGSQPSAPYETTVDGQAVTIDTDAQTVTCGEDVYLYNYAVLSGGYTLTVTYPNGETATVEYVGMSASGSGTPEGDYLDVLSLSWAIEDANDNPDGEAASHRVAGILVMGLGVLFIAFPRFFWYLGWGWRYKGAEPSEVALTVERAGGVVLALVGLLLCLAG